MSNDSELKATIQDILLNPANPLHKPYFDSGNLLHGEAVKTVSDLSAQYIGTDPANQEVFPVVLNSADVFKGAKK